MGRGFGVAAAVPHDVIREIAAEAQALGYSSFWVNDTPGSDGLAALKAAAEVTSTIRLGIGVIPLDRRPAANIAADADELELPQDRLYLGVGSGSDQKGLDLVRDGVEALRMTSTASLIVSALGPNMSRLAGEIGDGVLFNWLVPEFARRSGRWVTESAQQFHQPRPWLMAYVRCALLPQAEARLADESGRYASFPKYAAHFERMGVSAYDTCVHGTDAATLQAGIAAHEQVLDETVVRAITADDSLESIRELLTACAP